LNVAPTVTDDTAAQSWPADFTALSDERSGVVLARGRLVGLVGADSAEIVPVVERLGRFSADVTGVHLDGVPLERFGRRELRHHVVVSEIEPRLFSGRLREELTPRGPEEDAVIDAALHVASATDVLDVLEGGLDARVEERGRSFSGGQRQRLVLARALLTRADVVILIEPTSAVDAHTEQRIAERLRAARRDATTAVVTTSPLLLETTDEVFLLEHGVVTDHGTHRELLERNPAYRRIVLRRDEA